MWTETQDTLEGERKRKHIWNPKYQTKEYGPFWSGSKVQFKVSEQAEHCSKSLFSHRFEGMDWRRQN